MKKAFGKMAAAVGLSLSLLAGGVTVNAAYLWPDNQSVSPENEDVTAYGQMDGRMVISEPGTYTLTGEMRGTVFVDPGEGDVRLILDGARIDGANGPAIAAVSGGRLSIDLAEGSRNGMSGGPEEGFGAVIYSQVPLDFGGNGRLDLRSEGPDAICVPGDALSFNGGELRIQARENGLNAPDIRFNEGTVAIDVGRNEIVPDASTAMNGGDFQEAWTPGGDFAPDTQKPGFDRQNGDNGSFDPTNTFGRQGKMTDSQQTGFSDGTQSGSQAQQFPESSQSGWQAAGPGGQQSDLPGGQQGNPFGGMPNGDNVAQTSADTAGVIVEGITENSAMSLTADYDNSTTYTVTDEDGTVKITDSGTYIVTGTSSDGSITVKKETTGVVLILDDLDLTSTSGAALSINKNAEVQVIISGNVTLTDNENPDDEYSEDADVADAYDGAAIKVKAGSVAFITGDGTLTVNGNAKNGIKAGDDSSLIIGGDVTVNINAVNDGINGNYDVTILSGEVNISAGDDGIHADHILTVGKDGFGPKLTIQNSTEGMEGTVVNIAGGTVNVTASDDGINAANADGVYEGELGYSINITGGDVTVNARTDGLDSNGNVNLIGGSATIRSANNGGDAGIDYDGSYYVSDSFSLNNGSGVAGPDGMPGQMGGMPGGMNGMNGAMGSMSSGFPSNGMGSMNGQQSGLGNAGGNESFGGNMGGGFQPGR